MIPMCKRLGVSGDLEHRFQVDHLAEIVPGEYQVHVTEERKEGGVYADKTSH